MTADTGLIRFKREANARLDQLTDLVVGTGERPGLCESIRALEAEQGNMRSDIRQLVTQVNGFSAKLDALVGKAPPKQRLSVFFTKSRVRACVFVLGAVGVSYEAIAHLDQVTIGSAIGVVSAALFGFAMKWPTDTAKNEKES